MNNTEGSFQYKEGILKIEKIDTWTRHFSILKNTIIIIIIISPHKQNSQEKRNQLYSFIIFSSALLQILRVLNDVDLERASRRHNIFKTINFFPVQVFFKRHMVNMNNPFTQAVSFCCT